MLHELSGERDAAVKDYTEAIKIDDTNALAFFNRGNAYDQLGQVDLAIADYTRAIKLDPTDPDFYNNRGQVYDSRGEHDFAISDYTEAIRLDATNARPFYNRGLSYANKVTSSARSPNSTRPSSSRPMTWTSTWRAGQPTRNWATRPPPAPIIARRWKPIRIDEDAQEALNRLGGR